MAMLHFDFLHAATIYTQGNTLIVELPDDMVYSAQEKLAKLEGEIFSTFTDLGMAPYGHVVIDAMYAAQQAGLLSSLIKPTTR